MHALVFDVLIYYFYSTGKIEKALIEEFQEAGEEAQEVLGKESAKALMEDYLNE
jgi:hypothetical protein